ncbi:unnamed protein product [Effrenium voratum]|uniref:3-deoxy-7-phosphoheptulonate synthase n=1 Tax=Effrenium voratum TaxID=2562239 RepID=A0AA36MU28_9DINO|nr:unnamed protein product [Effrenium voratum]CAJ1444520.1 unnamed protein product [Effrenium voratum]
MARGTESAASTPGSRGPRSSRRRDRWAAALLVASLLLFAARCWADSGEAPPAVTQKVPSAAELQNSFPLPYALRRFVNLSRAEARAIIRGEDDRLLVIVGPCSIHDPRAARDYARLLQEVREEVKDDLLIFMRTYLEKPRTSVGWRGLISDPALNGQEDLARGLALGRRVLLDMNALGLPSATEFLDPLVAPYLEDVVSYGSIGARTVESPVHRQLAAHLAMPIGFKNGRNGDIQSAVNAAVAAVAPQKRLTTDTHGRVRIEQAPGNLDGHIILRGSESGPNFGETFVAEAKERLQDAGFSGARILIDCSHGNSGKRYEGEVVACRSVAEQVSAGNSAIGGVLIESFLVAGNQHLDPGVTKLEDLQYGCSVTDSCLDFNMTKDLLRELRAAVVQRRAQVAQAWQKANS